MTSGGRQPLRLHLHPDPLVVARLPPDAAPPDPARMRGPIASVTRTDDEVSLIGAPDDAPPGARVEAGWRALTVAGPLPFTLVGVLVSLAQPLAEAGVSIVAVSTFDTDHVLVREDALPTAVAALRAVGHTVVGVDRR